LAELNDLCGHGLVTVLLWSFDVVELLSLDNHNVNDPKSSARLQPVLQLRQTSRDRNVAVVVAIRVAL
jgi:hypothetical protein